MISYPIDTLVSYHYCRRPRDIAMMTAPGTFTTIADSGAFSAHNAGARIRLEDYAAWCQAHRDRFCWMASLDVIGDPDTSYRNWLALRDRYGILAVPTLHAGTQPETLDIYAGQGVDLVGLGGMAGQGMASRAFRWIVAVFRHARHRWPKVRFHLWGMTNYQVASAVPAWSMDSSGALSSANQYARMSLFDPRTRRMVGLTLRGVGQAHRHGELLRDVYGMDPGAIDLATKGKRPLLSRLAIASYQHYASWLQERHQVTSPGMYQGPATVEPRIHLADARSSRWDNLWRTATQVGHHVPEAGRLVARATDRREGDRA